MMGRAFVGWVVGGITLLLVIGFASLFFLEKSLLSRVINNRDQAIVIQIPVGSSLSKISEIVVEETDFSSAFLFELAVRVRGEARFLRAGEYEVPKSASLEDLIAILRFAPSYQHQITFPEGISQSDVVSIANGHAVLEGAVSDELVNGYHYLPETYNFERGYTAENLLNRMSSAFDKVVNDIWESRDRGLALASREELVILASIIEKETGVTGERALVSAVFHNRLTEGMRLQSDPTVAFAVGGDSGLERAISKSDLAFEHPYNTYRNKGLPPGPICMPGKAALFAAAHPAAVSYLYFVADGKGGHRFADDLATHNQNVALYREALALMKE